MNDLWTRWASRVAVAAFIVTVLGAYGSVTWYASAKVTADAMSAHYTESLQLDISTKLEAIKKRQDDTDERTANRDERFNQRMDQNDRQLAKLMFMACTTPPLGRCTADGVPK